MLQSITHPCPIPSTRFQWSKTGVHWSLYWKSSHKMKLPWLKYKQKELSWDEQLNRPLLSSKTLFFKMRLSAQAFLWKWVLFAWEWKMISISKAEHLPSFWNKGLGEHGNGLLLILIMNKPWIIFFIIWDTRQNCFLFSSLAKTKKITSPVEGSQTWTT